MKFILGFVVAALILIYRGFGFAALDGSAWQVRVRAKTLFAFSRKDTLVFERGRFTSARYLSSGYLPSGYSAAEISDEGSRFEASLMRDDGSTVNWIGEVRGERMKGTVVWTRIGARPRNFSFRGRRKPSPSRSEFSRRVSSLWRRVRTLGRRFTP